MNSFKDINSLIPHRAPFLFVDALVVSSLKTQYHITPDSLFLTIPNFLEAGIFEHQAQSVAAIENYISYNENKTLHRGLLIQISEGNYYHQPILNDCLETTIQLVHKTLPFVKYHAQTFLNKVLVAESFLKIYQQEL